MATPPVRRVRPKRPWRLDWVTTAGVDEGVEVAGAEAHELAELEVAQASFEHEAPDKRLVTARRAAAPATSSRGPPFAALAPYSVPSVPVAGGYGSTLPAAGVTSDPFAFRSGRRPSNAPDSIVPARCMDAGCARRLATNLDSCVAQGKSRTHWEGRERRERDLEHLPTRRHMDS